MIDYQSVSLNSNRSSSDILDDLQALALADGYTIEELDNAKPWGGYIRFAPKDAKAFVAQFFDDFEVNSQGQLSPKFLLVAPHQRLSWQFHHRRSEVWKYLTDGAVAKSTDPSQQPVTEVKAGGIIVLAQGENHRGLSLGDSYVLIAEIWQHTNPENSSNEQDIVRLEDDYNR